MAKKDKGRAAVEKKAARLEKLTVESVPASSVSPNTYNPNRQSDHDDLLVAEDEGYDAHDHRT